MTPIVENASMSTDLDCQFHDLLRVLHFYPVPANLVRIDDPRLSDPRNMLPGSVINESVSNHAAIVQSKLNLNGVFPPNWFAPLPDSIDNIDIPAPRVYAVRGTEAEYLSRKGAPNGYAAVDANLRLLPENVTPGPGLGTVSEVLFSFPDQFGEMSPTAGSVYNYNLVWKNAPNNSWFGVFSDAGAGVGMGPDTGPMLDPEFHTEPLPEAFFPKLDTAKFITGLFDPEVLPVAVGLGEGHAPGMVPDPGLEGDPDEYLGRDMEYHHFDAHHFYQPRVPTPSITLISGNGTATVTIRSSLPGSLLFYRAGRPSFREAPYSGEDIHITLTVPRGTLVEGYAAKEGYNNSLIASYRVPLEDLPISPDILDFLTEE